MAETEKGMSRFDVESLRETICVQEQLIQKLYNELDEESEASASAATEALSMILRLQGEKAAEEMEAEQYKRFVEEKMSHAEESLSILQELIDQKQMEIDALDYHARAYRYKLVSMGYGDDIDASDIEFLENLDGEMRVQPIGRCKSDPNIPLKYANKKRDEKLSPKRDLDDVSAAGGINLYCDKIERLEERVKQIAGANYAKLSSLPVSKRNSCNNFLEKFKDTYLVQHPGNKSENEAAASRSASPPNVLDVFEVPRAIKDEDFVPKEAEKQLVKDESDWHKQYLVPMQHLEICPTTSASETAEIRSANRTTFEIAEVERQCTRQETDRYDELMFLHDIKEQLNLVPMQHENKLHRVGEAASSPTTGASGTAENRCINRTTFEIAEVERQHTRQEPNRHEELMLLHGITEQLNLVPMQHENKLHRVGEAASSPPTSASETEEIHRVNRTLDIAAVERQGTRQEPDRHEELMLLREIKEQLNLIQSDIISLKNNKPLPRDEPSIVSLTEPAYEKAIRFKMLN
ncbi:hypothetical protein HAX54_022654 [Datura stramonium]|uniref:GTD-binding domain-containing protein n=1 Tax=Datura stramonium TaxID=4076 RepID=A0ABS8UVH1_DATST|nr:hypothetical protein [Datura stramonium]